MATGSFMLVEEDEIFACIGEPPTHSRKTSPHESFCPGRDSNPRDEGLSDWKPNTSTTRPRSSHFLRQKYTQTLYSVLTVDMVKYCLLETNVSRWLHFPLADTVLLCLLTDHSVTSVLDFKIVLMHSYFIINIILNINTILN